MPGQWHLDPDTGAVYDPWGDRIGTADGPPYTIPDDIQAVAWEAYFPDSNASVSADDLRAFMMLDAGNVAFGTPG